jgi:hypothetical protein
MRAIRARDRRARAASAPCAADPGVSDVLDDFPVDFRLPMEEHLREVFEHLPMSPKRVLGTTRTGPGRVLAVSPSAFYRDLSAESPEDRDLAERWPFLRRQSGQSPRDAWSCLALMSLELDSPLDILAQDLHDMEQHGLLVWSPATHTYLADPPPLYQAWHAIRGQHPELPAVRIALRPGVRGQDCSPRRGCSRLWRLEAAESGAPLTLDLPRSRMRTPHRALQALLHQAAHQLARVRQVDEAAEGLGHRHLRTFAPVADEVGLYGARYLAPSPGGKDPVEELRADTVHRYAELLADLGAALDSGQLWEHDPDAEPALYAAPGR